MSFSKRRRCELPLFTSASFLNLQNFCHMFLELLIFFNKFQNFIQLFKLDM